MRVFLKSLTSSDKKAIGIIWLIAVVVFGKSIQGGYLMTWDDNQQIVENEDVTNLTPTSIKNYFTKYYVGSYQPLASLSFGIEYAIFGKNAKVHHVTNLILHLLNIVLVYCLLLALFKEKYIPLIVTAFFAINPFQTEVLGWISTRSTLLYAFFILWASNIFVVHIKKDQGKITGATLFIVLFLYVLATLTKSAAIVFPFTLILLYVFVVRTWNRKLILQMLPFLGVSIAAGLVSISSRQSGGDTFSTFYSFYSIKEHIIIRLKTLYFYLIEPFYQTKLHIYRAFITSPNQTTGALLPDSYMWQGLIALVVLSFLVFLAFRYRKKDIGNLLVFSLVWFFVNIGLHFNFFAVSVNMLAERYMYLPIIALALLLVAAIKMIVTWYPSIKLKTAYMVVFIPLFVFYGFTSNKQVGTWKNEMSLYKQDIKYTQYHYSFLQLGRMYHKKKQLQKSLETFNTYVKMNPNETKIYLYRALLIADMGDIAYAEKDLYRILDLRNTTSKDKEIQKTYGQAFYHLGLIWQNTDKAKSLNYLDSAIYYENADAVVLKRQLNLVQSSPTKPASSMSGYNYKSRLSEEDMEEEGSVYEIVPKAIQARKYDKALFYVNMMQYVAPDSIITYLYKAEALIGVEQYAEAESVLEDAINGKNLSSPRLQELLGVAKNGKNQKVINE